MAFLNSKMVMGYYRTPDVVSARAAGFLEAPDPQGLYHLLDPCAGEGLALADVRRQLGVGKTFGLELDIERSELAATRLDRVLNCGYEQARLSEGTAGVELLWLNPPYDQDATRMGRMELTFLRETQKWLRPTGVLVYIVRQAHLSRYVANRLSSWFHNISVYRFPGDSYDDFQQVVVFAVKRVAAKKDEYTAGQLIAIGDGRQAIPELPETPDRRYTLPLREPETPWRFRYSQVPPAELSAEAQTVGAWRNRFWQTEQTPQPSLSGRPLMPLRLAHLAMYIASGLLNNTILDDGEERLLVKGDTYKVVVDVTNDDDRAKNRQREVEQIQTAIWVLDANTAELKELNAAKDFSAFMMRWRDVLLAKVQQDFPPLHRIGDIEAWQAKELARLMRNAKCLPRQKKPGLLPVQQEVAVAAYQSLNRYKLATLVMEPGTGKTATSLGVAKLMQVAHLRKYPDTPFRAVVITEEHLPEKWAAEVRQAEPFSYPQVANRTPDVTRFMKVTARLDPRTLCVLILPKSMAKLSTGWAPAAWRDRQGYYRCPTCGERVHVLDKDGGILYHIRQLSEIGDRKHTCTAEVDGKVCGAPLWQEVRMKNHKPFFPENKGLAGLTDIQLALRRAEGWVLVQERAGWRWAREAFLKGDEKLRQGGQLMWGNPNPPTPRYALADFIEKRYSGVFDLFIADEAHRYNAAYSDQAYAYRALVRAVGATLELTATEFNGKASSLFYRLFNHLPDLRRVYSWKDKDKFVAHYGALMVVSDKEDDGDEENGVYSGKKRRKKRHAKELPRVSPALLPALLPTHVFLQLDDMGGVLPDYTEAGYALELPDAVQTEYDRLNSDCKAAVREHPRIAGAWVHAAMAYPDTPFTPETIEATVRDF